MITIRPHGQFYKGFDVEGHANYGAHGNDILCASVSSITQMVAFELEYLGYATFKMRDGLLSVVIDNWAQSEPLPNHMVDMTLRALRALEMQYPEHITIEEEY